MSNIANTNNKINKNVNNFLLECHNHMASNNIPYGGEIIADGNCHRFSIDSNQHKKDEWYIAFEGISNKGSYYLCVSYGSWSQGAKYIFQSWEHGSQLSREERVLMQVQIDEHRKKRDELFKKSKEEAAKRCVEVWNDAIKVIDDTYIGYISHKGLSKSISLIRQSCNNGIWTYLIPLYDIQGQLKTIQYIYKDSSGKFQKRFHPGGEKSGNFHIIGDINSAKILYITEGWATGMSTSYALPETSVVIVAMDAGNIVPVVSSLRTKYSMPIHIAADNDKTGLEYANIARKMYGCSIISPTFKEPNTHLTDWNDFHCLYGIEEMRKQFSSFHKKSQDDVQNNIDMAQRLVGDLENPCKDFFSHLLPVSLQKYLMDIQKTTDAHPLMITASILGMMSSYIGKKVYINYFSRLYPNLWMVCISDSGNFKTTALNKGAAIAFRRQAEIYQRIDYLQNMSPNEMKSYGYDTFGLDNAISQERLNDIVLPTKCTSESLIKHLGAGNSGTIYASEFDAWLQNLIKKYNGDFMGILTDLYDVPAIYRNLTKTQGDDILREPFISLCGVSTLAWFKNTFNTKDVEGGFFARILFFALPGDKKRPSAFPKEDKHFLDKIHSEFEDHLKMALNFIGTNPREYKFSVEAKEYFENPDSGLFNVIYNMAESYSDNILNPFPKRWVPSMVKIAMLMQLLMDPETEEISPSALMAAFVIIIPAINSTAFLLQGELSSNESDKQTDKLYKWILRKYVDEKVPVQKRRILNARLIDGSIKEYDAALEMLVQQGKLLMTSGGSHNTTTYQPLFID